MTDKEQENDWFTPDPNPTDEEVRRAKQLIYYHPQLQPFGIQLFARMLHYEQRIAELEKEVATWRENYKNARSHAEIYFEAQLSVELKAARREGFEAVAAPLRKIAMDNHIPHPTHNDSYWQNDLIKQFTDVLDDYEKQKSLKEK